MIKALLILFLGVIFNSTLNAQSSGVAIYKYRDENDRITFYRLYFNAEKSLYVANKNTVKMTVYKIDNPTSIDDTVSDSKEKIRNYYQSVGGAYGLHIYHYHEEGKAMYKNFTENSISYREPSAYSDFIITETKLPVQNWTLIDTSKKIGKFNCQKATTTFRGRKYEAWYTLEIPVSNGPWKFHGLPGLILEISSVDKYFKYTFENLEIPLKDVSVIKPPEMGEKISIFDYKKEFDKHEEIWMRKQITDMSKRGQNITLKLFKLLIF